jgi:hypothetical protein
MFQCAGCNMGVELNALVDWLGYEQPIEISYLNTLCEFTRRVCYFSNHGSRHLYKQNLPSDSALKFHTLRAEFVLKLCSERLGGLSDSYKQACQYGWHKTGDIIQITWDDDVCETRKNWLVNESCQCINVDVRLLVTKNAVNLVQVVKTVATLANHAIICVHVRVNVTILIFLLCKLCITMLSV